MINNERFVHNTILASEVLSHLIYMIINVELLIRFVTPIRGVGVVVGAGISISVGVGVSAGALYSGIVFEVIPGILEIDGIGSGMFYIAE